MASIDCISFKYIDLKRKQPNKTYLTADINELLTLSANAKATSVKCGICAPFNQRKLVMNRKKRRDNKITSAQK
jgi:hypothetical protein